MADESKKKKFVVEEVVGDEPIHSGELEKEVETPETVEDTETPEMAQAEAEEVKESFENKEEVKEEKAEEINEEVVEEKASETPVETSEEAPMSAEPTPSEVPAPQKTNIKLVIILTAFIALILGGVAGGVLVFLSGNTAENVAEASPSPLATVVPTPTPEPEVDKQSVTVAIQNGSGIAGEGGRMSGYLTDEGFKVGAVGNASSFDHEETIIQVKDSVSKAFVDLLSETLSKKYKMGDATKLTSGSSDIIVIIGSEKAQ